MHTTKFPYKPRSNFNPNWYFYLQDIYSYMIHLPKNSKNTYPTIKIWSFIPKSKNEQISVGDCWKSWDGYLPQVPGFQVWVLEFGFSYCLPYLIPLTVHGLFSQFESVFFKVSSSQQARSGWLKSTRLCIM